MKIINFNIIWNQTTRIVQTVLYALICYFRFDIGEIIAQAKVDILADETLPELYAELAKTGADVLVDVIGKLPKILSLSKPQERIGITYGNLSLYYCTRNNTMQLVLKVFEFFSH